MTGLLPAISKRDAFLYVIKMMKKYFALFFAALSVLAVVACNGPEIEEGGPGSLSFEKSVLKLGPEEGSGMIALKTDSDNWSISVPSDAQWLSVSPESGALDAEINVYVTANGGARRSAALTVSAPGLKSASVTVIQEAGESPKDIIGLFADPEMPDADSPCTLYYRADRTSPIYNHTGDLYAHIGINSEWEFVVAEWGENVDKCKWQATDEKNLWSLELSPTIREYFGSGLSEISSISVVIRNSAGTVQTGDLSVAVSDSKYAFVPDDVVMESVPQGAVHGINYNSDGSVTLVLLEKDKKGGRYDYCYLVGEFSGWVRSNEYAMKRDESAGCWWITLDGLESGKEYMYQYYLVKGTSRVRISDPYSEIVYDGANDKYISSSTYPGLPEYPEGASGLVSAFQSGRPEYTWKSDGFKIADKDNMVIYEMLLRDFSASGDLAGAMDKLDYLQELGVTAIELMPVQEFDGNDSWGYNPCSYFAMDKAYGTREKYKEFIDECHGRGMAVLLDVVYNQATGAHPMAKMYWDASSKSTSASNPWFNVEAPHPYSVFHDWNHENEDVRNHVKRNLEYLLREYHVDGFRFDLTKGFTQKKSTETTASNYDASRIAILKDYNSRIREVNPDAVVILEHFCADDEEKELARDGMKVWRNLNNAYCQSGIGISSDSGFQGLWTGQNGMSFGGYVGFMESHDEERVAYKQSAYGASSVKGKLDVMMRRCGLNAAFFLTVPGPKMIWQFGEMGYDISIETGGRTGKKPLHWEYLGNSDRKALHDTYAGLLRFRSENPEFFGKDASFSWNVSASDWAGGRFASCTAGGKSFALIGNFDVTARTITRKLPASGSWRNWFDDTETYSGDSVTLELPAGEFRLLLNF